MKKFAAIMLCAVLMLSMLCSSAMAGGKDLAMKDLEKDVKLANHEIKSLVHIAQKTPYDDVDWLQANVELIVKRVKAHASLIGAQISCTIDYYWIDGRWVGVDPLMVVNIRQ